MMNRLGSSRIASAAVEKTRIKGTDQDCRERLG